MDYKFPVKYYDGNIVYGENGVWAYYELSSYDYDFKSDDKKIEIEKRLASFCWDIKADVHFLVIPEYLSIGDVSNEFRQTIDGMLKDAGIRHLDEVVEQYLEKYYDDSINYRFLIGVKLNVNEDAGIVESFRLAMTDVKQSLYQMSNLGFVILESDIRRYRRLEEMTLTKVLASLSVTRIKEEDIQLLIERSFVRGMEVKEKAIAIKPDYELKQGRRYIEGKDILRLTEGYVDDTPLNHIRLSKGDKEGYTAFLPVSRIPYQMLFPGCEYIYMMQNFKFPMELSIRVSYVENDVARRLVSGKKKEVSAEGEFAAESGERVSNNVLNAQNELHKLESRLESSSQMPLLKTSIVFGISAGTKEELRERTRYVKNFYRRTCNFVLEQPHGDQFLLFNEFLPGAHMHVSDYVHHMEPDTLASGMFGAVKKLGDDAGFFIGTTGVLERLVYLNPSIAVQGIKGTVTNSASASFTGSLGGGKSFLANLIVYLAVLAGAKVLLLDPKGERGNWTKDLVELEGQIHVIELSSDEAHAGLLDPYMILSGKDAAELALSVLTYLTGVKNTDIEYFSALSSAVTEVSMTAHPCMMKVIEVLREKGDKAANKLANSIQSFSNLSIASLLFGDGKTKQTINLESALNVLQIQNLQLPDENTKKDDYSLMEILSVAMMLSISAFALKFIQGDRGVFKIFVQDESWAVLSNSQGKALSNKLLRAGRAMNAAVYIITQGCGDISDTSFKNNIGMKFAFRSTDTEEIDRILEYFDLPKTRVNSDVLKNLKNGYCLFKDISGHVGVLHVNAVFKDLEKAFDTRAKKKKVS